MSSEVTAIGVLVEFLPVMYLEHAYELTSHKYELVANSIVKYGTSFTPGAEAVEGAVALGQNGSRSSTK